MPGQRLAQGRAAAGEQCRVDLSGRPGADARMERRHPRKGGHVQRVDQQARIGDGILDVRGLGIAQAAIFVKGDAAPVELHFQLEGMKARPEQHGDVAGRVVIQQFRDAGGDSDGLRFVAQGRDQTHGRAAFPACEKTLAERFRGVRQDAVGHVQNGTGGSVVLFQPDDARSGKQLGEIKNVPDVRTAKRVDGLGFVAHSHDVSHGLRRGIGRSGQQPDDACLYEVGILIFVHKNVAKTGPQAFRRFAATLEERFQLKEQIVIVQQPAFPAIGRIGFSQAGQGLGMGQKLAGFPLQDGVHGLFLVARLAQQTGHGLCFRKGAIPFGDAKRFLAFLEGGGNVRAVHEGEGAAVKPDRPPAAKHAEREGMKGAALYADQPLIAGGRGALQHLMGGLPGKGQQQHGRGRYALFRQPCQTVYDGACLAAARAGHDQYGAIATGGGLVLGGVQMFSEIHHGNPQGGYCSRAL